MSETDDEILRRAASDLAEIEKMRMPFGKYGPRNYPPAGIPIYDLPAEYLQYFATRGWPRGKLGRLLQIVYQMKADGGDGIFQVLRERAGGRTKLRKPKRREWEFPPS
jgi:hypothetical protein